MAEKKPFQYDIDKITERETVFDFVSRLSIGRDFVNQDYDSGANSGDKQIILPKNIKLKDGVLMQIIRALDISDKLNLDKLKTSYKSVAAGTKTVNIADPTNAKLIRIVQEKTGMDVTEYFSRSGSNYTTTFDVAMTNADIFKAYYTV